jgi:hypothetical protein
MARQSIAHTAMCMLLLLAVQASAFIIPSSQSLSMKFVVSGALTHPSSVTQLNIFKKNKPQEPIVPEKKVSAFKWQNFLNPIGNPYILVPYFLIWIYWIDYVNTHP